MKRSLVGFEGVEVITILYIEHLPAILQDETQTILMGLWYVDEYRRTDAGWRISRREEVKSWVFNAPDFMNL